MAFIKAEKLKHKFVRRDEQGEIEDVTLALDDVNIEVEEGQFIAVLGHNGSGKSTFAKHLNALLTPSEGTVWVDGKDTSKEENILDIRKEAGMIFQNPDNQIVAGVVEEDVAFGPENIGVPTEEIWERVGKSLEAVGMTAYRYHSQTVCPADRSSVWRLPVSWRWSRSALLWMSLPPCWIQMDGKKY